MELACPLQVLLFPAMKPEEKPQGGALKPQVCLSQYVPRMVVTLSTHAF